MMFSKDPDFIRLAGCVPDSSVDGPGIRYVLFLQGCGHNCHGCHNPVTHSWFDAPDAEDVPVALVLKHFDENAVAKRVTISGGEPFGQPYALLTLLKGFIERGVMDIWLYTGYTLEELLRFDDVYQEILSNVSTLVDGRFVEAESQGASLFTGSRNQNVYDKEALLAWLTQ